MIILYSQGVFVNLMTNSFHWFSSLFNQATSVYTERDSPGGGKKIGEDGKEREITKESKVKLEFQIARAFALIHMMHIN